MNASEATFTGEVQFGARPIFRSLIKGVERFLTETQLRDEAFLRLNYSPSTGKLHRRYTHGGRVVGSEAGKTDSGGYRQVRVAGCVVLVHRLVWLMEYGYWPNDQIDHINRNPLDNRIENLRIVRKEENQLNTNTRRDNTSGFRCVTWNSKAKKWRAQVNREGRRRYLGLYATPEAASAAVEVFRRGIIEEVFS